MFGRLATQTTTITVGGGILDASGQLVQSQTLAGAFISVSIAATHSVAIDLCITKTHTGTILAMVGWQSGPTTHTVTAFIQTCILMIDR